MDGGAHYLGRERGDLTWIISDSVKIGLAGLGLCFNVLQLKRDAVMTKRRIQKLITLELIFLISLFASSREPYYGGWQNFLILSAISDAILLCTGLYTVHAVAVAKNKAGEMENSSLKSMNYIFISSAILYVVLQVAAMSTTLILDFRWIEGIRHFSSAFLSLLSAIFVLYYIRSLRAMVSDHRERMSVIFDRGDEERLKKEKVDMEVKSASRRHGADDEVTKEVTKRSHSVVKDNHSASDLTTRTETNFRSKINSTIEYKLVKSGVTVTFPPTPLKTQVCDNAAVEVLAQPVKQKSDNYKSVHNQVTQIVQNDLTCPEKHVGIAQIYSSVSASDHQNEQQKSLSSTTSASAASFTPNSSKVINNPRRIKNSPCMIRNSKISPGSVKHSRPSSVADMRDAAKAAREKVRKKMEATTRKLTFLAVALPFSYTMLCFALAWLIITFLVNPNATFSSQVNSISIKYKASLDFVLYSQLVLLGVYQYYAYVPPPLQPHSRPASQTESPRAGDN